MIKVTNLTKRYGRLTAVDNLTFEVAAGEIVGFLGPNGAGKTTTMQILTTYLPPTGGRVEIGGFDIFSESQEVRRRIGYLPEACPLYSDMRVIEYLRFRARLKGLSGKRRRRRIDEVMENCGLSEVRRTVMGRLSKGYRQRIGLADSLLHEPELLILDEPTIGLDPNQIRLIRNLIKSLAERHTVLLSTHILQEVEMICSRVLIIDQGRIVASDTPDNLLGLLRGHSQVVVEVRAPRDVAAACLGDVPGVLRVSGTVAGNWSRLTCECRRDSDVRLAIFKAVIGAGWDLRELRAETGSLEDVFVEMTANGADLERKTPASDPSDSPGQEPSFAEATERKPGTRNQEP